MKNYFYIFKVLSTVMFIIAVSAGFYFGLGDDRTAAVNPDFGSVASSEYEGDMIGVWTYGANVLLPSRFSGMGYSYVRNDTGWLYMMGGDIAGNGTIVNRNERYNLRTNSWSVMAPMLGNLQYFGAAKLKDSLYSIAGMVTSFFTSAISNLRKYDINSNTWVERSPLPQVLGWPECVGYQDSIIYSAGGCINGTSTAGAQVWVYNTLNNSWRPGTPLPIPREGGALGLKGDTLVYVGGASDYFPPIMSTVYVGLISQSNRANITWTTGAPKPGTTTWRFDAHDWGCKGIIVDMGTNLGFGTSTEVYVYSPGLNTWTQMPNALVPTSTSQSGSFAFSGNVYKLVCASGLIMQPPYSIPHTQIFTDTLCYWPPFPVTSFCRNGLNKNILDHILVRDTIIVSLGITRHVIDLNVRIDTVTHTYDNDLTFYIRKGSTAVKIINRVGGGGDNFIRTILNDSAATPIAIGSPPFTGSFKPSNPLTLFNIQPTDGPWILTITDTANGDTGYLKAWCLIITYNYGNGVEQTVEIPNYYALGQNYPNPFNPATIISYAIPESGNVKLIVYDILGREVAILVNELKQAGTYDMKFDASNLSSGVYFYRIETNGFTQTKRMLFIK